MSMPRFKPYPAYKDSGVEWLGEIPAHWEIAPVYSRYEVALGKMLDAKRVTGEFSSRYLRNVDVQWDTVNTEGLPEMDFAPRERDRYGLRFGDLLVCEGGEVGRTAIWRGQIKKPPSPWLCVPEGERVEVDLHPDKIDNPTMGTIFEELIRKFNEALNENPGEHFTPRDVVPHGGPHAGRRRGLHPPQGYGVHGLRPMLRVWRHADDHQGTHRSGSARTKVTSCGCWPK